MTTEFKLPELGENINAGDVVALLVSVGDTIEKDQPVLEIETDKAAIEVPSSVSGVITAIHVEEGGKAEVGKPILTVETDAAGEEATESIEMPQKKVPAPEVEPPSPSSVGERADTQLTGVEPSPQISHEAALATPAVRRFARELGLRIHQVPGTGPSGRISMEDVKSYARQVYTGRGQFAPPVPTAEIAEPLPDFSKWGKVEREPMGGIRRATASRTAAAWAAIPHVTNFDKADITALEKLRKQYTSKAEAAGGKLTITAILLKIAAGALKQFPQFCASVDVEKAEIIYKKYYHIGVAVDTAQGLLVPVIRDVNQKNIIELAVELSQTVDKARNQKLGLEEMQGGTFTITNLGGIGGTNVSPIINAPEVAILGVARGRMEPVFIDGEFQPRLMLPLALSYDHRLIDGADAARFLRGWVELLENPFLIALEG